MNPAWTAQATNDSSENVPESDVPTKNAATGVSIARFTSVASPNRMTNSGSTGRDAPRSRPSCIAVCSQAGPPGRAGLVAHLDVAADALDADVGGEHDFKSAT